jgi:hypothetical protein
LCFDIWKTTNNTFQHICKVNLNGGVDSEHNTLWLRIIFWGSSQKGTNSFSWCKIHTKTHTYIGVASSLICVAISVLCPFMLLIQHMFLSCHCFPELHTRAHTHRYKHRDTYPHVHAHTRTRKIYKLSVSLLQMLLPVS